MWYKRILDNYYCKGHSTLFRYNLYEHIVLYLQSCCPDDVYWVVISLHVTDIITFRRTKNRTNGVVIAHIISYHFYNNITASAEKCRLAECVVEAYKYLLCEAKNVWLIVQVMQYSRRTRGKTHARSSPGAVRLMNGSFRAPPPHPRHGHVRSLARR